MPVHVELRVDRIMACSGSSVCKCRNAPHFQTKLIFSTSTNNQAHQVTLATGNFLLSSKFGIKAINFQIQHLQVILITGQQCARAGNILYGTNSVQNNAEFIPNLHQAHFWSLNVILKKRNLNSHHIRETPTSEIQFCKRLGSYIQNVMPDFT